MLEFRRKISRWINNNTGQLYYTGIALNSFVALLIMMFGDYKIGFAYIIGTLFLAVVIFIWNE
jgi:hypothetical protein